MAGVNRQARIVLYRQVTTPNRSLKRARERRVSALLPFELVEGFSSIADSLEAKPIDEVERRLRPLVVLMLVVCPEDELRYGVRIADADPSVPSLFAKVVKKLLAHDARDSWQPVSRSLQQVQDGHRIVSVGHTVGECDDE
jgi:hypothetical protein